jgi:hypothetical protein
MFYAGRRPMGRLFYWGLVGVMLASAGAARPLPSAAQSGPAMTTVSDTVYRADECLNASTWAKESSQPPVVSPLP